MFRYTAILFFSLIILFCTKEVYAQNANLEATYRFLNLPSSARMAALGGNNTALPNADISHFLVNPAYLNNQVHGQVAVSYLNHIADLALGFASFAYSIEHVGTLGLGFRYMGYGDIPHTNAAGEDLGSFSAGDFAMNAGIGRAISPNLQAGASLQFIHSSYHTYTSSGIALSAGLFYSFDDEQTWAGIAFGNLGRQITYFDDTSESLPFDIRASITRDLEHLPLRLSVTAHSLTTWELPSFNDEQTPRFADHLFRHLILGGEFLFTENVHLRLGYNHFLHEELRSDARIDLGGASIGLGISVAGFRFDVSRNSYSDVGRLTQLSIQYQL